MEVWRGFFPAKPSPRFLLAPEHQSVFLGTFVTTDKSTPAEQSGVDGKAERMVKEPTKEKGGQKTTNIKRTAHA